MKESVIEIGYKYALIGDLNDISFVKIAGELGISRRSIYRMFANKEEFLFEIYKRIIDELLDEAHNLNKLSDLDSGFDKTICAVHNMIRVFLDNTSKLKYITKYDAIPKKSSELLITQSEFYRKCDFTYGFIVEGIGDKTIRNDIDAYKMSCIILEIVIGYVSRYIDLSYEEYSLYLNEEDLYTLANLISCYLKVD